jgi:hypothetical protein
MFVELFDLMVDLKKELKHWHTFSAYELSVSNMDHWLKIAL